MSDLGTAVGRAAWLAVCLLALTVAPGSFASQPQGPSFSLNVTPLHVGSIGLLTVVLLDAPAGLQRADLKITIETKGAVQIIGSERLGLWPTRVVQQMTNSIEVQIVDLFDAIRPGAHQIPLLQLKLQTSAAGETRATLVVERFQDDRGGEAPVLSFSTPSPSDAQGGLPTLIASDVALKVGEKTQDTITLAQAPQGLQSADIILSIEDPTIARFTDVAPGVLTGDAFMVMERTASAIHLRLLDLLTNLIQPGAHDQILAKLTLEGLKAGQTRLLIQVINFVDDQGNSVTPQTSFGQITVTAMSAPTPPPQPSPPPPPAQGVALVFSADSSLPPQAQGTADLILTSAPQGLQRYDVVVRVSDSSVAQLNGVTAPALDPRYSQIIQSSSSTMEIRAVDFDNVIQSGAKSIVLAHVALTTLKPGKADLTAEAKVLTDDLGHAISAANQNFTLTVELPPIGGSSRSPQDLDGDGLYEDIDGDGALTILDAIIFAFNYDSPEVQKYSRYYDFNGDGRVDFADVLRLLKMVLQQSGA
jgi:PKD repeat protein